MAKTVVHTHKLSNGLKVIIIPNGKSPVANVVVLYNVGTADDPLDAMGLAHFLEHMMFMGTKNIPSDQFKKMIQKYGGSPNAFTGWDYTAYYCSLAVDHIDLLLQMEADRMMNLSFTEKEIQSERKVVMQERLMRLENHPFGQVWETILKATHPYHPYGVPPIGYPQHINNYHYNNTHAYYKKWYMPNNATVIVCGNIDHEDTLKKIEKYFGSLKAGNLPKREREANPPRSGIMQRIVQKNPRNAQILFEVIFDAPHHKKDPQLARAMILVAQLLGGNAVTEFYEYFVVRKKLALQISSSYDPFTFDPFGFGVSAVLAPNIKMEDFQKEFFTYLKEKSQKGFSKQEVEEAKNHYVGKFAFLFDGNEEMIHLFLGLACGYSLEDLQNWKTLIKNVPLDDVNKAFQSTFNKDPLVIAELYPKDTKKLPEKAHA